MSTFLIPPFAEEYESFTLKGASGILKAKKIEGVSLRYFRQDDENLHRLDQGSSIDLAEIYLDELRIYTDTGNPGRFDVEIELSRAGTTQAFTINVLVGRVLLDCDADRDGTVELDGEGKANWIWGENGRGAMVLVDNDSDLADGKTLEEREPIIVRPLVTQLPEGTFLRLSTAAEGALNFSVVKKQGTQFKKILGRLPGEAPKDLVTATNDIDPSGETLLVAAHAFPGPFFEGLLIIKLELVQRREKGEQVLAVDRVMLRVAPWIMTPNTLQAKKIYTCRIDEAGSNNKEFIAGLTAAVKEEGLELEVIDAADHRGDRWIQDEIEIGYSQTHRGTIPVVFDSPRDRGLDHYPEARMLGPDFGHFVVGGGVPNSLDSFGNLEVSPPVTVDGRNYPLGRVIIGGRRDGQLSRRARQMMAEVRQFLYSQRVQFPFEVYTDWLGVGHIDEIVSFVSDESSPRGFRCLLASPGKVKAILLDLQMKGHGAATMFQNKNRLDDYGRPGESAEISIDELLSDASFWSGNAVFQGYMDEAKSVLKRELGLDESDFVDIPVAFKVHWINDKSLERTLAYFPDMVNHLAHKDLSIVPKPYGPIIAGKCAFEKAFEDALPTRRVKFIDDWYSYHEQLGEVHCGTNALRKPFAASRWWHVRPEGAYDIKSLEF